MKTKSKDEKADELRPEYDLAALLKEAQHRPDEAGPVCLGGPDAGILHSGKQLPGLLPSADRNVRFSKRKMDQRIS